MIDDYERRRIRLKRLAEIDFDVTKINEEEYLQKGGNPYRVQAMNLIMRDKEVPNYLKEKIEEYDQKFINEGDEQNDTNKG